MPESTLIPSAFERDGTNQQGRHLSMLAPESVGIDERRIADWLAFTHTYAKELKYIGLDNQVAGDWSGFLNPAGLQDEELPALWQEIEGFMAGPERFDDTSQHRRPHFVLFLAFLQLLHLSQQRLNRLTQEHLDFYYQKFLALEKQPPQPDRVSILAKLAGGASEALLPKGTLLNAGKDSRGELLHYSTDEDLIVNRAQVKSLYSLFVDKKVTGIRNAREAASVNQKDPLLAMFAIVYGNPAAADQLPIYPPGKKFDAALLDKLGNLVNFVADGLHMDFQEFRAMMLLKNRRNQTASDDWTLINSVLESIGKANVNDQFKIEPPDSPAFWTNLVNALNGSPPFFASIPGDIKSLESLYYYWHKGGKDASNYIDSLLKLTPEAFARMMERKMEVDKDWRIVNELLEVAGRRLRKNPAFQLLSDSSSNPYNRCSPEFVNNFRAAFALDDDKYQAFFASFNDLFEANSSDTDLDRFNTALQQVEKYFYCPLEDFAEVVDAGKREKQHDSIDWQYVYAILASAYAQKVYAGRRQMLDDLRQNKPQKDALEIMLRLVLDAPALAVGELLSLLVSYSSSLEKQTYKDTLQRIKAGLSETGSAAWNEQDWQAAVEVLELVWRKREGIQPVAQKETWLNLYTATDATSVKLAGQSGTPRWRTFGQGRSAPGKDQRPVPLLGWFIASPVLSMSRGKRDVILTLIFRGDNFDSKRIDELLQNDQDYPFQIEVSSEKGWVTPTSVTIESGDYPGGSENAPFMTLILKMHFNESAPPLAALPGAASPWPMLRLLLRSMWQDNTYGGSYVAPYPLFQVLILERVLIDVDVVGLTDLGLANDVGRVPSGKPFEPFGFNPAAGSVFKFMHPELAVKRLDRLALNLQWMNVPAANIAEHYQNYSEPTITANSSFTAKVSLLDRHTEIRLPEIDNGKENENIALFDTDDAAKPRIITIGNIPKNITEARAGYIYAPDYAPFDLADAATWFRYWRMELNSPDFQHGNYAKVAAAKSVELAVAVGSKTIDPTMVDGYKVNPPYTPKLKSFSVNYSCTVEIVMDPSSPKAYGKSEERIFYQQAFGAAEIQAEQDGLYRFLPSYPYQGELYIGLENLAAPQDVAVLLQMAEGSSNPDLKPQPVIWSYLSGNRWLSLNDGGILADSTNGLVQSGIIKFRLPPILPSTLLPAGLYWLRAAVARDSDSICDTIAIHTQAVSATWIAGSETLDHLGKPLPAKTISKTVMSVPGISAISQPYSSYGGKPKEQDVNFNLRISERLRHKQRAVIMWDYERLILEGFPEIYKAKCIPVFSNDPANLGKVAVIVIPDIRNKLPFDPFEPKATAGQIAEISAFLFACVPPTAEVEVKNAYYLPIRVRFAVRFMPNCDPGFYKLRLNEELNRFLSPWAYEESNDVSIGGKIYANAIVDFLERRPYVDYVAELKLFKDEDGLGFKLVLDASDGSGYWVGTDRPDGVLVASRWHDIDLISDTEFEDEKFNGIGYMKIELDFIVN